MEELYYEVGKLFVDEATRFRDRMINDAQRGTHILTSYASSWKTFSRAVRQMDSLFMYFNRLMDTLRQQNLPQNKAVFYMNGKRIEVKFKPIGILGLHFWKTIVLEYSREKLGNVIVDELLEAVAILRTTGKAPLDLIELQMVIKSFCDSDPPEYFGPVEVPLQEEQVKVPIVSIYEREIEAPFIAVTEQYFQHESSLRIAGNGIESYIKYAEARLCDEAVHMKVLFPDVSYGKIMAATEKQLIMVHTQRLQSDFKFLLDTCAEEELTSVYHLLQRIPDGIEPLTETFEYYVFKRGQSILCKIAEESKPPMICSVYTSQMGFLHRHLQSKFFPSVFQNDGRFLERLNKAFTRILSLPPPHYSRSSGELLAETFDKAMLDEAVPDPSCYMGSSDSFSDFVSDTIMLVKHLPGTELFIDRFVSDIAKRFIFRLSKHGDIEGVIVTNLAVLSRRVGGFDLCRMSVESILKSELKKCTRTCTNPFRSGICTQSTRRVE